MRCSSCLLRSPWGKPRSPDRRSTSLWALARRLLLQLRLSARKPGRRPPGQGFPTQNVVQGFLDITPSSSSSQVWKLGNRPLRAGQRPNGAVGPLWGASAFLLSTRGHLDDCAPTRPAVHLLSPVSPVPVPSQSPVAVAGGGRRRAGVREGGANVQVSAPGRRSDRTRRQDGCGTRSVAPVTSSDPAGTRSPQAVHIPGDNFSTSRPWSPFGCRR